MRINQIFEGFDVDIRVISGPDLQTMMHRMHYKASQEARDTIRYLRVSQMGKDETHITAWHGGVLIGDLELQVNPYDQTMVWLKHISTKPDWQNKGVAAKMLRGAFKFCHDNGFSLKRSSPSDMGAMYLPSIFAKLSKEFPDVRVIASDKY